MSLDGRFLHHLAKELNQILPYGRIQKISQLAKTDFLFMVRTVGQTLSLLISVSSGLGRIHLSNKDYDNTYIPSGFCMLLRKHLEGGVIQSVSSLQGDRIIEIVVSNISETGDSVTLSLFVELMGKYANLIVTDEQKVIIDSFLRVSPFDETSRTILKGLRYQIPEDGKINPFDGNQIQDWFVHHPDWTPKDFIEAIRGSSPLFADYYYQSIQNTTMSAIEIYQTLLAIPVTPTLYRKDKVKFYYFDVFPNGEKQFFSTLSELLEDIYFERSKQERVRQIAKNITATIKRELERNKDKLEKLTKEWMVALQADRIREEADFLKAYQHELKKGEQEFQAFDYKTNQIRVVKLQPLLSPTEQVQSFYRKYKKQKNAVMHLETQMASTQDQVAYFEQLQGQLDLLTIPDFLEIATELGKDPLTPKQGARKKPTKTHFDTYEDQHKTIYYVGKNNLQNEQLTHKIAKATDWWFHVQHSSGAHVVVSTSKEMDEYTIRMASQLASLHSPARLSSSVPVDYTLIRNVKKIAHKPGFFVQYKNQKTIYIDPNPAILNQLKRKK